MLTLGIDPDVSDLAIASWDDEDGPGRAMVVHAMGRQPGNSAVRMARLLADTEPGVGLSDAAIVAVEGQQVDGRVARTKDLFTLAHVTGAAISWADRWNEGTNLLVPTPSEWKGGVAKYAMQARLYSDLGWSYHLVGSGKSRYAVPVFVPNRFSHITKGQWKHVGDALLLARWAHQQIND